MAQISAVIIAKDEAFNLPRCVGSLAWADEIVVLDTGSRDNTIEIARSLGCQTYSLAKWEGFGPAKQKAVELAAHDWVLSIDADEVLSPPLQKELQNLAKEDFRSCAWRIRRRSYYLGSPIRWCGWRKDSPLRIFDRQKGGFNAKLVHESVVTTQDKCVCTGLMYHYTYPTRTSHFAKMRRYGDLGARQLHEKGKRSDPLSALVRAQLKFIRMYVLQLGFLDGWIGFLLCLNSAWGVWYKYHRLWKLSR